MKLDPPAHRSARLTPLALSLCLVFALVFPAAAEPVRVRVPEGPVYGFVTLSTLGGQVLAYGEVLQTLRRGLVESRLTFRFKDGSLFDETVVFSQQTVFSLITYRLIQRGPSFPGAVDLSFERASGQYKAHVKDKSDKPAELVQGQLDLPADLYNGMSSLLLKSLHAGESAQGHLLAFTPKPRVLTLALTPVGEDPFYVGATSRKATRYRVKPEVGGMLGVLATVMGKEPPDLHYWIVGGPAPSFVKFEGPFFVNGPVWRIELARPRWPK